MSGNMSPQSYDNIFQDRFSEYAHSVFYSRFLNAYLAKIPEIAGAEF